MHMLHCAKSGMLAVNRCAPQTHTIPQLSRQGRIDVTKKQDVNDSAVDAEVEMPKQFCFFLYTKAEISRIRFFPYRTNTQPIDRPNIFRCCRSQVLYDASSLTILLYHLQQALRCLCIDSLWFCLIIIGLATRPIIRSLCGVLVQ